MKKRGHYCKVCGEYKANEKFSGKGHAAHICKTCAALPPERQAEEMTLTRLVNLPWRLSKEQLSWLKKRMKDRRDAVRRSGTYAVTYRASGSSAVSQHSVTLPSSRNVPSAGVSHRGTGSSSAPEAERHSSRESRGRIRFMARKFVCCKDTFSCKISYLCETIVRYGR